MGCGSPSIGGSLNPDPDPNLELDSSPDPNPDPGFSPEPAFHSWVYPGFTREQVGI